MDRTDFFGGKHKYHRDADGLYSPPPYLYDETDADYDKFLVSGPIKPLADIEHGMDGTIKHFVTYAGSRERVCDYIQGRYGTPSWVGSRGSALRIYCPVLSGNSMVSM